MGLTNNQTNAASGGTAGEQRSLAVRSGTGAEATPPTNAVAPAKPFRVNAGADPKLGDWIWIRDARGRLDAIRLQIEEESFEGEHITAIEHAIAALLNAADVIDDGPERVAKKLNEAAQWIKAEQAERMNTRMPAGADIPATQARVVRDVEAMWTKRMVEQVTEELRAKASEVERNAVDAMKNAEREVGGAWDRAVGPAVFSLIEGAANAQVVAIKIELLREELRMKRLASVLDLFKGYVARGETEKEIMVGIVAMTLIEEVRSMTPTKLEKKLGRMVRSGDLDKELYAASDLERMIEQRKQARVEPSVLFARKVMPVLLNCFSVLLGADEQLFMSSQAFRDRFLSVDSPPRNPLDVAKAWATRNMLLPKANERPLVGPRTRGR